MMKWMVFLYLLTSAVFTAITLSEHLKVDLENKIGETILIRSWSLTGTILYARVKWCNIIHLNTIFPGHKGSSQKCPDDLLMPKYNLTLNEASLIFSNVSREDERLYQMEESFYWTKTELYAKYKEKNKQGEVARGYVGENIIMEFSKSSKLSFLYHHDKKVAIINDCECRLFPGTQFAGRLRCSRNEFDATCTIIIQNVTQRDAGLYKVVREDTVMELWFLNITGTATINTMNPVTLQGSMAETQLHQVSTEAPYRQRTPVKPSISTMNPVTLQRSKTKTEVHQVSTEAPVKLITVHIPDNVIPAVIGVVGVIILMIGFLIWIQRKNTYDHVTVQRLIIEKCETPSFSTPTTIRRTIPMPAWEEGRADRSVPLVKALHDAILGLYCSTTPRNADSVDTLYSSIHSLEKWVDDKPKGDTMFCSNKSSERPNTLVSACDESAEIGILGECPSICTLVSKSGGDDNKTICTVQRKVAKSIQALFEKVNDEPAVSSKYYKNLTASGKADSLCRNEYQMEALSSGFEHEEEFQDVKIASKSTKTRAAACQGTLWSRKEFIHGTEEDNGYETFENIKYTTPVQNDKVSKNVKFLTIKDEEPKEGKRLSDKASKDYADVDL